MILGFVHHLEILFVFVFANFYVSYARKLP